MARITEEENRKSLAAAEEWKRNCLLRDGSVFGQSSLWTRENLDEFSTRFVENFKEGKEGFFTKLSGQLAGSKSEIPKLAAEMLWVLFIFPTRMSGEKKRQEVTEVWSWSGDKLDPSATLLVSGTEGGIGYPGTAYNTHRFRELSFFIRAMQSWKALSAEERGSLLGDPWRFGVWLDTVEDSAKRQFRHILVYLLFPDNYERIASKKHKALILSDFANYLSNYQSIPEIPGNSRTADDHKIFHIRKRLEQESPNKEVDFYWTPWREVWLEEAEEDEESEGEVQDKAGPRRYWVEKCKVEGRVDREAGEHALGKALWSPQASSDGRNIYAAMREVRAGDVVLHLVDNEAIKGVSLAAGSYDDSFVGLPGTDWAGRPA